MVQRDNHHFLLVTFPAQGHINPSLQFAKRLLRATNNTQVTFSTTTSAHRRMLNNNNNNGSSTASSLAFAPFSDGFEDGYNPKLHTLEHYVAELRHKGSQTFRDVVLTLANQGRPVTCVIYSVLLPWVANVARDLDVPSLFFWNQSATMFDIYYYYFNGHKDVFFKNAKDSSYSVELPGLPSLATRDLPSFFLSSNTYQFVLPLLEELFLIVKPERVLVNTFDELEPEAIRVINDDKLVNLIAVGPSVPSAFLDGEDPSDKSFGGDLFNGASYYMEWLSSKAESSVVYVSFGSVAVLAKRQVAEIARGLAQSTRPFLLVARKNQEEDKDEEMLECLSGCVREGRGLIVPWCSQVEVLSHGSIGCFLTHCGWNSTLESLSAGVPVVAFPQGADQTTNAKMIEDVWETGVRVRESGGEGNLVESEEIKRCVEEVMEGERSGEMRRNAKKWRDLARKAVEDGGSSERNLRAVLEEMEHVS